MAQYLLFDGALNQTFIELPAYIWIMLAIFLLIAASNVIWYFFFWQPLTPVHGHFQSHIHHTNSALTFDEHLNFVMRSEKKAKLIFDVTTKEAKELQKDWEYAPSGLIGRVLDDLIFDGGKWLDLKSPVRADIERIAAMYNEANPDDMIMTLGKFHKKLSDGSLNGYEGVSGIKSEYLVPWNRIDFAIPKDHIQPMWDGYLRQLARQLNMDSSGSDMMMYGYLILGISAFICLGMIAIKFLK